MTAVVDLRGRSSWEPASVLAPAPQDLWPNGLPLTSLGAVAEPVRSKAAPDDGVAVVTPGSVDRDTWAITATRRRSGGKVTSFGAGGLRAGDLLVPPTAGPVLLVNDSYAGFVFSGAYLALRLTTADPLWLWAALNTGPGWLARDAASCQTRTGALTPSTLLGLVLPLPPGDWGSRRDRIAEIHASIAASNAEQEVGQSWWRTAELPRHGSWGPYLATREPERLEYGAPLGDLAVETHAGVRVQQLAERPQPGWLPYLTPRDVRALVAPSAWTNETRLVAEPGDIVVAEVGARGPALAVTEALVPGNGLLLARFSNPDRAAAISSYLNSAPGQAVRRLLVGGVHIPHLGLGGLRRFPVPTDILTESIPEAVDPALPALGLPGAAHLAPNSSDTPLSELLERLLWS